MQIWKRVKSKPGDMAIRLNTAHLTLRLLFDLC